MKRMLLLVAALSLAACAPRYNPNSRKPDNDLSCREIRDEIARAQKARDEADRRRGLSWQNAAWALIYLPGIQQNENANAQTQQAADERTAKLNQLYAAKRCAR